MDKNNSELKFRTHCGHPQLFSARFQVRFLELQNYFGIWTNIREQNFEHIVNFTLRSPSIIFCLILSSILSPISRVTKLFEIFR